MFDRDNSDESGFKHTCKQCRSEGRSQREKRERAANIGTTPSKLDKFDQKSLELLDAVLDTNVDVPHIAEIFQSIVRLMGGVSGLSGHFMAHLLKTPMGSPARTRLFSMMFRMAEKVTESGVATPPLEMLSDADLERMHTEKLKNLVEQQKQLRMLHSMDDSLSPHARIGLPLTAEFEKVAEIDKEKDRLTELLTDAINSADDDGKGS